MVATDRQRLIRLIHVAKRELGLDDEAYRDLLQTVVGKRSAADMDDRELQRLFDHLKTCGFKVKGERQGGRKSIPMDMHPQSSKIRALWLELHEMGVVRDPSELALSRWVKRETHIETLGWLNGKQASHCIEKLKKWIKRVDAQRKAGHAADQELTS